MTFHEKAVKADKNARTSMRGELLKKHPYIDLSQFKILTHIDSSAKAHPEVLFMDKSSGREYDVKMNKLNDAGKKALVHNKPKPPFPKIWSGGGTIYRLPKGKAHGSAENRWYDGFPNVNTLNYLVNDFRIYVNGNDYFLSKLPIVPVSGSAERWNDGESYYQVLFAIYCASYCCGVSIQHLQKGVYPIITSIMKFHLYFTMRRIVKRIRGGESAAAISKEFGAGEFYGQVGKVPRSEYWKTVKLSDGTMGEKAFHSLRSDYKTDYRKYIPAMSNGFTKIGLQYLNQSIEAYIYCVLGAQARTRTTIVGHGGGSLESQQVFRQLVEDSIVNYSISTWILNMNKAIQNTNVVQNLAISPSLWLVPSEMVILKKPIPGYNNVLITATNSGMRFGINPGLNYNKPHVPVIKKHIPSRVVNHLETLSHKTSTPSHETNAPDKSNEVELVAVLVASAVGGYLASMLTTLLYR